MSTAKKSGKKPKKSSIRGSFTADNQTPIQLSEIMERLLKILGEFDTSGPFTSGEILNSKYF